MTAMTPSMGQSGLERALAHWGEVFGLALHLTGNRTQAEDLCQETYLRVARVSTPADGGSLRPLLFTVLRNLFRSELRRKRPGPLEGAPEELVESAPDPAARAATRDDVAALRDALQEMAPEWRAMLYLRDGLGLSYREIAIVLDKTDGVVRTTLHRARLRARDAMKRRTEGEQS